MGKVHAINGEKGLKLVVGGAEAGAEWPDGPIGEPVVDEDGYFRWVHPFDLEVRRGDRVLFQALDLVVEIWTNARTDLVRVSIDGGPMGLITGYGMRKVYASIKESVHKSTFIDKAYDYVLTATGMPF